MAAMSSTPPDANGVNTATRLPAETSAEASEAPTTVLPTPVSVPVMNSDLTARARARPN